MNHIKNIIVSTIIFTSIVTMHMQTLQAAQEITEKKILPAQQSSQPTESAEQMQMIQNFLQAVNDIPAIPTKSDSYQTIKNSTLKIKTALNAYKKIFTKSKKIYISKSEKANVDQAQQKLLSNLQTSPGFHKKAQQASKPTESAKQKQMIQKFLQAAQDIPAIPTQKDSKETIKNFALKSKTALGLYKKIFEKSKEVYMSKSEKANVDKAVQKLVSGVKTLATFPKK